MRAKFTNESVESILKPVSGDEIKNKFKECILKIYPDFNERAQKLLDVLMTNNFYAPIMNDLETSREYENTSSEDKMMAVVNGFMNLMDKLDVWDKSIKDAQETIEGYIEGMKALSSYKSWNPRTTYYKG
ncbi:MAG: hypothetical protein GYA51_06905 [Candidatus Methanofastidiosa archaeon]|nr:hypothetical protein [Candidatus Methanofastidiosa archaeon]